MRISSCLRLFMCLLFILDVINSTSSRAVQATDAQTPRRREFGSSLKNLEWDPQKRMAVEKHGKTPLESEKAEGVIKLDTTLVVFPVLVTDRNGRTISGLKQQDFVVTEDNEPQQIAVFTLGDDARRPRSIVLLLEWSKTAHFVRESLKAAEFFVSQLAAEDRVAVVTGNLKLICDFTRDKTEVISKLSELEERAKRGLRGLPCEQFEFTTLFAVLKEMIDEEADQPIIVFQADGGEAVFLRDQVEGDHPICPSTKRSIGLSDIDALIARKRVTIYPILIWYYCFNKEMSEAEHAQIILQARRKHGFPEKGLIPLEREIGWNEVTRKAMNHVAEPSGGSISCLEIPPARRNLWGFRQSADVSDQASLIYSQILSMINQRYVIGYYPANRARDGRRRSVQIHVRNHPEYVIQSRGYIYAPAETAARKMMQD
jgi:VWFA-related protein